MFGQTSHQRSNLQVEEETSNYFNDVDSRRRPRLFWTGLGFAGLMLLGVSAWAVCPLAPRAKPLSVFAKPSLLEANFAFSPVLQTLPRPLPRVPLISKRKQALHMQSEPYKGLSHAATAEAAAAAVAGAHPRPMQAQLEELDLDAVRGFDDGRMRNRREMLSDAAIAAAAVAGLAPLPAYAVNIEEGFAEFRTGSDEGIKEADTKGAGTKTTGLILASLAAVFNGSFASIFKLPSVAAAELDPILFQLYVCIGVFLSSFLTIPFYGYNPALTGLATAGTDFVFEPLGLAAGGLLVLALSFSFAAIEYIGIALGKGVWGGIALCVSYAWGVAYFGDAVSNPTLAAAGLALLATGVAGIAFCDPIGARLDNSSPSQSLAEKAQPSADARLQRAAPAELKDSSKEQNGSDTSSSDFGLGLLLALGVGLTGGSILVPSKFVPDASSGLVFVLSLAIGALAASPLVCAAVFTQQGRIPPLKLKETFLPGLFAGFLFNIGNVMQIIAIPMVGLSIAGPILQCSLFVSGLWGVFVFREIEGPAVPVFFLSGAVLIGGAACLALSS